MIFGHGIQMNDDKVREILAKDPAIQTAFRELDVAIKARNRDGTGRAVDSLLGAIINNESLAPVTTKCESRRQPRFCYNVHDRLVGIQVGVSAGFRPGKDLALTWRVIDNDFQYVANYFAPTGARDVGRLMSVSRTGFPLPRDLQGVVGSYLTGTDESMSPADQKAAMKAKHGQAKPLWGGRRKTRKGKSKKKLTRRR